MFTCLYDKSRSWDECIGPSLFQKLLDECAQTCCLRISKFSLQFGYSHIF